MKRPPSRAYFRSPPYECRFDSEGYVSKNKVLGSGQDVAPEGSSETYKVPNDNECLLQKLSPKTLGPKK